MPDDAVDARTFGDEPAEVRRSLPDVPLIIGRDRVAAAEAAASRFDGLILDDGFQHLPLARRADLVIWDDAIPNKRLVPAGPLREPKTGLSRASAVATPNREPLGYGGTVFVFKREFTDLRDIASGERLPLGWLQGKRVDALCAIARPGAEPGHDRRSRQAIGSFGAEIRHRRALGDHDPLADVAAADLPTIITEKDATKITAEPGQFYALGMRVRFTDEEAVAGWLKANLSR